MSDPSKRAYNYTVLLEKEPDGGYHAFCPTLKGCHSQGDSYEDAIANITEAIALYLESLHADGRPIPQEDLIVKPLSVVLRAILQALKQKSLLELLKNSDIASIARGEATLSIKIPMGSE